MLRSLSIGTTVALAWAGAALTGAAACGDDVDGFASTSSGNQGGGSTGTNGSGGLGQGGQGLGPVPDFSLLDVNETSPTYDTRVSPRDYLGRVSAWYFAEAS